MSYALGGIGFLVTLVSAVLMTMDNAPANTALGFFLGVAILIAGAIVANRNRRT